MRPPDSLLTWETMNILDRISRILKKVKPDIADQMYILNRFSCTDGGTDWAINNAGLNNLSYDGNGEKVSILDTGVDQFHKDLQGRVELINLLSDSKNTDINGHGTFIAGEILAKGKCNGITGVAPMAKGFCYKVLYGNHNDSKILNFEKVLQKAIYSSIENNCGVISMSIGLNIRSNIVENALLDAVDNGIIPIAAAGNDGMLGSLCYSYPAAFPCCISVAAANEKGLPVWFSTVGIGNILEEQPEIAVANKEYYWGCLPNDRYGKLQGTSMACPIIAGTALLWRQAMKECGKLPEGAEVLKSFRKWLKTVSLDTNKNGWDSSLGWGVLFVKPENLKCL